MPHRGSSPALSAADQRAQRRVDRRSRGVLGIATLVDAATAQEVPSTHGVGIAGVGRHYDLAPGSWARLPVALAVDDALSISLGLYQVRAKVHDLALEAPFGRLRVMGRTT